MRTRFLSIVILLTTVAINAQQKKVVSAPKVASNSGVSISNADLGTFPYFKTLPSFTPTDSITIEQNRTYFFDGKTVFTVDGKVSFQNLNLKDEVEKGNLYHYYEDKKLPLKILFFDLENLENNEEIINYLTGSL